MPKALFCPGCQTRYLPRAAGLEDRCPACGRPLGVVNSPPVIYWRVVGVALATATLFVITTIFALKAWADGKRSAGSAPGNGMENSIQPENLQPQEPAVKSMEKTPAPAHPTQPPAVPAKPNARHAREVMVAKVAKPAPSGFN